MQRLQSLAQLSSGVGIQQRVDLYDDVQVRTASLTAGSDTLDRALQVVLTVAVIAILLTAPLGAFAIDVSYRRLLRRAG